jgi:VanZ family protein
MKENIGVIDRQIRYLSMAALIFIALFAPLDPIWRVIVLVLAAIAFITAITGW